MVQAKEFREDLYYRPSVVSLEIPSLRYRSEDIRGLNRSYIEHFCSRTFPKR